MIERPPSLGGLLAMAAFALSCFGILVFLWVAFGGSLPLQPEGYRVRVALPEAAQLAEQADVRIAGVRVGKVEELRADRRSGLTDAVLELESRFAPIPRDARAILRQKTLLGETYVELSPGRRASGTLPDDGRIARGRVAETVELDEIVRSFDAGTRQRFSLWLDQQGRALERRGARLNAALASLAPFAEQTDEVLELLRGQSGATRRFVRDTGAVFDALAERQGQLRELIVNANRVVATTAIRDAELADTIRVLPVFLREGRVTVRRLTRFAQGTDPLVSQLRPAARRLSPLLSDARALAPDLKGLFTDLDPLVKVARRGLPAASRTLDDIRPLLARLDPFLRSLTPIVDYLGLYRREIAAFLANDVASTQATGSNLAGTGSLHYLRTTNPTNPEVLAAYPHRIGSNRSNPYTEPGGYDLLRRRGRLDVYASHVCSSNPVPAPPAPGPSLPADLVALIERFVYGGPENAGARPPCVAQRPLGSLVGQRGVYPALRALR